MGTRCKECDTLYFPPRADCPKCRGSEIAWVPIDGKGKLITFTEVYFAPPAFQDATPYLLGLAELDDGLRVFAPISSEVEFFFFQAEDGIRDLTVTGVQTCALPI